MTSPLPGELELETTTAVRMLTKTNEIDDFMWEWSFEYIMSSPVDSVSCSAVTIREIKI